jgi:hypothetical protein
MSGIAVEEGGATGGGAGEAGGLAVGTFGAVAVADCAVPIPGIPA